MPRQETIGIKSWKNLSRYDELDTAVCRIFRVGDEVVVQDHRKNYAKRLEEIEPFRVMKLLARANELQEQGRPIVHMEVGEPDFPTPKLIVAAGQQALLEGKTKYTPAEGIPILRERISERYFEQYGVDVAPARIFVTAGGSGALLLASALTLNAEEGLLMTDPGYPCNRHFLKTFSAQGQLVPVSAANGYQLSVSLIEQYWQPSTRGVLLASPSNPTGAVIPRTQLTDIVDCVLKRDGHVIVDEIYHGLHYSESRITSALEISDQVIVLNSFSKYFGMTGWRLGWLVVPEDAISLVQKLAQNLFICPSAIAQYAALGGFTPAAKVEMEANREALQKRRDFLVQGLRALGFGIPEVPDGAFYVYAKIPDNCEASEALCSRLLENHNVAITPGTDFGFYGAERHVRLSYAQNLEVLAQGLENISSGLFAADY